MRAVFFDAGGTLLHIDYARVAAAIRVATGIALQPETFLDAEYAGRAAVEEAMASGFEGSDDARWGIHFRAMLTAAGLDEAGYAAAGPAILAEHRRRHLWSTVRPGTADGLAALVEAGYTVAVVSNADGTVERLLEQAGLRGHLAFVVDSSVVGIEKPDPRIFHLALDRAGVAAADSLYVGDLYPVDVVGSRAAGIEPILLDPLGRYRDRDCRTVPDVPTLCRDLVTATTPA